MVTFKAKVYDGETLVAETKEDLIVFYNTICDYKLRKHLIKGTNTMSYGNFIGWLEESRCVPMNRIDLKRRLDELGLKVYDPLRIVDKTHGIMYPMDNIRIDITDIVEEWKVSNKEMNK